MQLKGALGATLSDHATSLTAPGIEAKNGIALAEMTVPAESTFSIQAYTALLLRWQQTS